MLETDPKVHPWLSDEDCAPCLHRTGTVYATFVELPGDTGHAAAV
jgi:hypothetical protein